MKSVSINHYPSSVYLVVKDGVKIIVESFNELKDIEREPLKEV